MAIGSMLPLHARSWHISLTKDALNILIRFPCPGYNTVRKSSFSSLLHTYKFPFASSLHSWKVPFASALQTSSFCYPLLVCFGTYTCRPFRNQSSYLFLWFLMLPEVYVSFAHLYNIGYLFLLFFVRAWVFIVKVFEYLCFFGRCATSSFCFGAQRKTIDFNLFQITFNQLIMHFLQKSSKRRKEKEEKKKMRSNFLSFWIYQLLNQCAVYTD